MPRKWNPAYEPAPGHLREYPVDDPYVMQVDGPIRVITWGEEHHEVVKRHPLGFAPAPRHRAPVAADSTLPARRPPQHRADVR